MTDMNKPVSDPVNSITDLMERTAKAVEELVSLQTPGIRGIEGTETVPELFLQTFDIPPGESIEILGNRKRRQLTLCISPVQRAGTDVSNVFLEIKNLYRQEVMGVFIDINRAFVLNYATNALIVRTCDGDGNTISDPVTVSIVEENGA